MSQLISCGNAAGLLKRPQDVEPLLALDPSILSAITLGSYTLLPREGNVGQNYWSDRSTAPTSVNSLGLPNPGIDAALEFLPDLVQKIHDSGKRSRVSIAGFSPREFRTLAQKLRGTRVREIELNLACPNVVEGDKHKRIIAFVPELIEETLNEVYEVTDDAGAAAVAVKLTVYSDPYLREEIAAVIDRMQYAVQKVVLCNTFPNVTVYEDNGRRALSVAGGRGGLAGSDLHHIAVSHVRDFRNTLPSTIDVEGVGGISRGAHAQRMAWAGATGFQVGTAYFEHQDPRVFVDIMGEYAELEG